MPGSGEGGSCLTPKVYCLNGGRQLSGKGRKDPEKQRSQGIEREDGGVQSRKTKALSVTKILTIFNRRHLRPQCIGSHPWPRGNS